VGSDCTPLRFDELARQMGALGFRTSKVEEVKPALSKILDSDKPGVLEISIDPRLT